MRKMKQIWDTIKKYKVTVVLLILFVVMGMVANQKRLSRIDLVYCDSLDMTVATVEGEAITLRDFAIYVAYQEAEVQELAIVYDADNPKAYWNVYTEGGFVSQAARKEAMSMAIHDELFYQLYQELNIPFTEEEMQTLQMDVEDFWADLTEYEKQTYLGVSQEDIYNSMYKIACAQKAQAVYAAMKGFDYEAFDFYEEDFREFLEAYEYEVDDSVLNRLDFGNITLVY